jgi:hypothetical protein
MVTAAATVAYCFRSRRCSPRCAHPVNHDNSTPNVSSNLIIATDNQHDSKSTKAKAAHALRAFDQET